MSGRENNDFPKNLLATITPFPSFPLDSTLQEAKHLQRKTNVPNTFVFRQFFLATSLLTPQIFLSMAGKWNDEEWLKNKDLKEVDFSQIKTPTFG
jgi:hypothetical protein